LLYQSDVLIF
jgi:hypothetical protein